MADVITSSLRLSLPPSRVTWFKEVCHCWVWMWQWLTADWSRVGSDIQLRITRMKCAEGLLEVDVSQTGRS